MKTIKIVSFLLILIIGFTACKQQKASEDQKVEESVKDKSGPEYTSAYVCPMHCKGSGSNEPGLCSICGMDYRKNPDHEMHKPADEADDNKESEDDGGSDENDHEDHEGHDHD